MQGDCQLRAINTHILILFSIFFSYLSSYLSSYFPSSCLLKTPNLESSRLSEASLFPDGNLYIRISTIKGMQGIEANISIFDMTLTDNFGVYGQKWPSQCQDRNDSCN